MEGFKWKNSRLYVMLTWPYLNTIWWLATDSSNMTCTFTETSVMVCIFDLEWVHTVWVTSVHIGGYVYCIPLQTLKTWHLSNISRYYILVLLTNTVIHVHSLAISMLFTFGKGFIMSSLPPHSYCVSFRCETEAQPTSLQQLHFPFHKATSPLTSPKNTQIVTISK